MLGTPQTITLAEVIKLSEAVKLAESAKDLDFRTSYKLARLGDAVEAPIKSYNKTKKTALLELQQSKQENADVQKYNDAIELLLEQTEEVAVPEFKLSEFVYTDKGNKETLDKMKVSQRFLNLMFAYIEDDLTGKGKRKSEE